MSALFIEDGYTRARKIPARPGMHPAAEVVYRPALDRERKTYAAKAGKGTAEELSGYETDLIAKYVVSLNAAPVSKEQAARIEPNLRADVVDLILSFAPGDAPPDADAGN